MQTEQAYAGPIPARPILVQAMPWLVAMALAVLAISIQDYASDAPAQRMLMLAFLAPILLCAWYAGPVPGVIASVLSVAAVGRLLLDAPVWFGNALAEQLLIALGIVTSSALGAWQVDRRRLATQGIRLQAEMRARELAQSELRRQGNCLHSAFSCIADGVIFTDRTGHVTRMNAMAEILAGWSADRATGRAIGDVFCVVDEAAQRVVRDPLDAVLRTGTIQPTTGRYRLQGHNGTSTPIEHHVSPLLSENGTLDGAVLVFRDVSERRRSRERQSRLLEELRDAERLKDESLARLAHELRNPLAAVLSALQILELSEHRSSEAVRARGILKRQVQQMVRLIDDLLPASRMGGRVLVVQREPALATSAGPGIGALAGSFTGSPLTESATELIDPFAQANSGAVAEAALAEGCADGRATEPVADGADLADANARPLRILVVDDNADAAEALGTLLDMMGHEVHIRQDGGEAIAASASLKPDVVLLDIGLPVLSGHEAAPRIREQPGGEQIFLVALTGYGQTEDKRRSFDSGFAHHLVKPVAPAALEQLMLDARRHRDLWFVNHLDAQGQRPD